jgi:transcriptional regulator with XRE-family HTH domain
MNKKTPIPKRLKEAREASGFSQRRLGISAGIDEFSASARMNQYEKGKYTPDFSTLTRIAEVLGIPTAYFYAEDNTLAEVIKLWKETPLNVRMKILYVLKMDLPSPSKN